MHEGSLITAVDEELREWLQNSAPKTVVSMEPPANDPPSQVTINCYLLSLAPAPPQRMHAQAGPLPQQFALRYLISVHAKNSLDAHDKLGPLVFAAMDRADSEVELGTLTAKLWQALGVIPRPAFVLRVPLRLARPQPVVGIVKHPIVIKHTAQRQLSGHVLGPDGIPLSGARLEFPTLGLSARTNHTGYFTFPAIPSDPLPSELIINARGRVLHVAPQKHLSDDNTLIITFPIPEN